MATSTFDEQEAAVALRLEQAKAKQGQDDGEGEEAAGRSGSLRSAQQAARRALAGKTGKSVEEQAVKQAESAVNKWLWGLVIPSWGLSIIGLDFMLVVSVIRGKTNIPNALAVLFVSAIYYLFLFGILYMIVFIGTFAIGSLGDMIKAVFDFGWDLFKPIIDLVKFTS